MLGSFANSLNLILSAKTIARDFLLAAKQNQDDTIPNFNDVIEIDTGFNIQDSFTPTEYYSAAPIPTPEEPEPEQIEKQEEELSTLLSTKENQSESNLARINKLTAAQKIALLCGKFVEATTTVSEVLRDLLASSDIAFERLSYEASKLGLNITDLSANSHKDHEGDKCGRIKDEISKFLVLV